MSDSTTKVDQPPVGKIRQRYLTALVALLGFAILLFFSDWVISFVIIHYLPGLGGYIGYLWKGTNALIGILGAYVIYRILISVIDLQVKRRSSKGAGEIQKLLLRVAFYFLAIFIILTAFGVSTSSALAGGAVGGIVIGLAAQTVVTSILSGLLLSTSKTLFPGDIVLLKSSYWGSTDTLVRVIRVNTLYTEALTQNNSKMRFPNPLILNYVVLTHLNSDSTFDYPLQVSINADVSASAVKASAQKAIAKELARLKIPNPEIILLSKSGGTSTFTVMLKISDFLDVNKATDVVNMAFDDAYWEAKRSKK